MTVLLALQPVHATDENSAALISIIIDDMGDRRSLDERVIALPGNITCAFLPHAAFTSEHAKLAHTKNKEVMLHMPMQPLNHEKMPPFSLSMEMDKDEFVTQLQMAIKAVPHVKGINNHMGSLLTQQTGHMSWFMHTLKQNQALFFVDSRTTEKTVAAKMAASYQVPYLSRDMFLDRVKDSKQISQQFQRLLQQARKTGSAVAIAHPYPETIAVLERELPKLKHTDIRLIHITTMIQHRAERRQTWQTYSSHSPTVVKNSRQ